MKKLVRLSSLTALLCLPALVGFAQDDRDEETEQFIRSFHQTLNIVVNDYIYNFGIIKGAYYTEENGIASTGNYEVSACLPEADECYLNRAIGTDQLTYVASFISTPEYEDANSIYESVAWLVSNCDFSCCQFVFEEKDEPGSALLRSTSWVPAIVDKTKDSGYGEIFINLRLMKTFDIDEDLQFSDSYLVVLNIQ